MSVKRLFAIGFVIFLILPNSIYAQTITKIGYSEIGKASYYPDDRNNIITQGGYKFNKDSLYAAHQFFPFGSIVKVRNVDNGKIIKLKIVDRPYTKNRILDMTYVAAQRIDIIGKGNVDIEVTLLDTPQTLAEKKKNKKEKVKVEIESLKIYPSKFSQVGTYLLKGEVVHMQGFGIQLASSTDLNYILNEGKLINENYLINGIFVQTGWSNDQKVFRLLIGNFNDKEKAAPLLQLFKNNGCDVCFIRKHLNK